MKKHLRLFVNLGFWKPCVLAKDLSESEIATYEGIEAQIALFFPIVNNVITLEVTDVPAKKIVTLSDVHHL